MPTTENPSNHITTQRPAQPDKPSAAEEISVLTGDPDFMTSLAKGLAVMRCFAEHSRGMTVSQISMRTGISRASVRRCLITLARLGYALQDGQYFHITPKVLGLGYAYLSSTPLATFAQPFLERVHDSVHESCSLSVLEGDDVVYIARAETQRIMSVALRIGSRLPAYCTSMGRVLLAHLAPDALENYLQHTQLIKRTPKTISDPKRLRRVLQTTAADGYALVDQEVEVGLRSIAVPIMGRDNQVIAAMNVGVHVAHVPLSEMPHRILPHLLAAAKDLSRHLGATV